MPTLTYTAAGFPAASSPALTGTHLLNFSWSELTWAAITVGRAGMTQVLQFGLSSAYEIVYRMAMVYANLVENPSGRLSRSSAYDALDPSEKGAVSYFLGLSLAKLFAERCLQVPWLLHLDVYRAMLSAVLGPGRSKPDLVGRDDKGDWIVIESKGRTQRLDQGALNKAKIQSQRVRTISGASPKYRMGVQSYFESACLCLAVDDPRGEGFIDLPITRQMIDIEYYRPLRGWLEEADRIETSIIENRLYWVRVEPQFDFAVGLDADRYRGPKMMNAAETSHSGLPEFPDRYIGKDGVLVQLGPRWSVERMREEPERRIRLR
jgi:hypothetical protein